MKKVFIIFILFLNFPLFAQNQNLVYQEESLVTVIKDLEEKFSVRFSFNSEILEGKTFNFSGEASLDDILNLLEKQVLISSQKIDESNIILKKDESAILLTQAFNLDEVLLNAEYLTVGFDKNEDDGSIKVSPSKLGILPGLTEPDVLQSLQMLPGISSPTETASDIHIRGGTPDQNLVLWDGIKMYHQGHFFGQISAFNPYITETINVFRSGTSAKYGDRISGVVDIRSSEELPDSLEAGIGINLVHADVFIKAPLVKNKLSLTTSARRSYSDILNSITFQKMSNKVFQNTKIDGGGTLTADTEFEELKNRFYFTDYNLKLLWKPNEKHTLSFSSLWVTNKLDYKSKTTYTFEGSEPSDLNSADDLDLTNNGFNFKWDATLSDHVKLNTTGYISNYTSAYFYEDTFGPDDLYKSNTANEIKDKGFTIGLQYAQNKHHVFRLGYDMSSNDIIYQIDTDYNNSNPFLDKDDDKLNLHSLFTEYVYLQNKWTFQAGLRASKISSLNKSLIEPRLYINRKLNNFWDIKASYETKNQTISKVLSTNQNYLGLGNSLWVLADNDRPIMNSKQFSIGFLFEEQGWKLDVDAYYKKTKGLTALKEIFNTAGVQPDDDADSFNKGKSESFGIDFLVKKQVKDFRTWLSYSLSKTNYFFDEVNNGKAYLGNFDQTHVLSLSNTYKYNKFQFSLGWSISTGKPYTNPKGVNQDANLIDYDEQNALRLKTYHKLDASVVYDFLFSKKNNVKGRIGFSVINIYDRKNELEKTFRLDSSSNNNSVRIVEQTNFGLGITPNLVFRLNF
ncbi:TonB-dependent receptor plug domain-containing protein [Pseudofulvibacter geojedonensis]|uniref:TonB-dependent receptor plug domain-containing protein n=1 Tax=Pseudofulvibacter geojedonensis TaxID=1123758 RepID=A0ABW3I531_9FLAO